MIFYAFIVLAFLFVEYATRVSQVPEAKEAISNTMVSKAQTGLVSLYGFTIGKVVDFFDGEDDDSQSTEDEVNDETTTEGENTISIDSLPNGVVAAPEVLNTQESVITDYPVVK